MELHLVLLPISATINSTAKDSFLPYLQESSFAGWLSSCGHSEHDDVQDICFIGIFQGSLFTSHLSWDEICLDCIRMNTIVYLRQLTLGRPFYLLLLFFKALDSFIKYSSNSTFIVVEIAKTIRNGVTIGTLVSKVNGFLVV